MILFCCERKCFCIIIWSTQGSDSGYIANDLFDLFHFVCCSHNDGIQVVLTGIETLLISVYLSLPPLLPFSVS